MTKSKRRVGRKYGGVLCNNCVVEVEKYKTRMEDGFAVRRDLTIEKYLPVGWFSSLPEAVQEASRKVVAARKVELAISEEVAEELGKPKHRKEKVPESLIEAEASSKEVEAPSEEAKAEKPKKKSKAKAKE